MGETKPFQPKLTPAERNAIFEGYVAQRTGKDRDQYVRDMMARYDVSRPTIYRITHDPKRMEKWLQGLNHAYDIASGQILAHLGDALGVQLNLIEREDLPANMLGLKQNAAVDLMNRAGLKKKDDNENTLTIRFSADGFGVGMPPASEDDAE